jgi:hypothetical protein
MESKRDYISWVRADENQNILFSFFPEMHMHININKRISPFGSERKSLWGKVEFFVSMSQKKSKKGQGRWLEERASTQGGKNVCWMRMQRSLYREVIKH